MNTEGSNNTFIGEHSGDANTTGSNNTTIGALANVTANNLSYATAVGAGATVDASNTVVLGRNADKVQIPGHLTVAGFPAVVGNNENLKIIRGVVNSDGTIAQGSGFTVSKTGTGLYTINFPTPFTMSPVVTANAFASPRIIAIGNAFSGSVDIRVYTTTGAQSDWPFHFTAVGPR